ncbi:tetratricopeptide repeat protein [Sandaracinobacteroides saxicola]|uniref:Tetratricopeptide repeat protein n=1 Tax=Sandaracinobacteroides saxicola TaxID=2759707 RepID=A0A7G5IKP5_9SPHN|nr:tetratricopeptide repeat protein [Sandaracinobacteroides saxicola]QMW23937.1 tetratricopeptide repeat protein [Sandaracinobacteroides saxicola]
MASKPPASDPRDDAFIREVDEEYRRDEVNKLFARWGRPVLLALIVALAAFGGYLFWRSEQAKARAEAGEAYLAALNKLDSGGSTEAVASLAALSKSDTPGYRALALLAQAAVAARGGDVPKALGLYRAVADDATLDPPFRDLAKVKAVRLEFDSLPPAQVVARLKPYVQPDNPWFAVAAEMTALAHLKAGEAKLAGPLFLQVAADRMAPPSARARAEQMAAMLGQDTTKLLPESSSTSATKG